MIRDVISIDLPYACFGIIVENDIVIEAPPIAKWATGKSAREVLLYFKGKGAKIELASRRIDGILVKPSKHNL